MRFLRFYFAAEMLEDTTKIEN